MHSLSDAERRTIMPIIFSNKFTDIEKLDVDEKIKHTLLFYKNYRAEIADPKSELYRKKQEFEQVPTTA